MASRRENANRAGRAIEARLQQLEQADAQLRRDAEFIGRALTWLPRSERRSRCEARLLALTCASRLPPFAALRAGLEDIAPH